MLRIKTCWKKINLIAKAGNFQEFLKMRLDYDHVMSFLVIGRKYVYNKNPYFAKAIAASLKWIELQKDSIPMELANEFKDFFTEFVINDQVQAEHDLISLFKLCRQTRASVSWIKLMKRPYCLFEDLAALSGCTNVIYEMIQFKHLFTLSYFDFIDYIT